MKRKIWGLTIAAILIISLMIGAAPALAIDQLGRPYVAAPGTPVDVLKILQEAFKKACADPQVKAEAAKVQMELEYVTAADCMDTINFVLTQPEDVIKEFVKYSKM